ncbi:MAG: putative toxin-antitoxin system toxin component, PIN family [Candidatus Doudnabacteria bacterium]|nr:putative toxin-antitoxin system toxin component, PIN family [Candidatus Doudnabacteria bacterium]
MKTVIDTNVLINGFKDEYSYEKRIIDAVIGGEIKAFANRQTLRENKLISSQLIDNDDYHGELEKLFSKINWVVNKRQINVVRDPEDNKILESAVEANAEYLITSDNDLLMLEKFQGIQIVTPQQFWNVYQDHDNDLWKQWTNFITKDRTK